MVRDRLQTAAYGDRSASFRVSLCSLECGCRHRREMRWIGVGGSETLQESLQALRIKWAQVHTTAEAALCTVADVIGHCTLARGDVYEGLGRLPVPMCLDVGKLREVCISLF